MRPARSHEPPFWTPDLSLGQKNNSLTVANPFRPHTSDAALAASCLDVVATYVAWMDINLITHEAFIKVGRGAPAAVELLPPPSMPRTSCHTCLPSHFLSIAVARLPGQRGQQPGRGC